MELVLGADSSTQSEVVAETIAELRAGLSAVADVDKAEGMAAYTKGHFTYLGVQAGDRRIASKALLKAAKTMDPDHLLATAQDLWAEPEREFHYVGMDLLRAGAKNLRVGDLNQVRSFIEATPWWDTVDSLAIHTTGTMVAAHPDLVDDMDFWIESDDIWIARTAILHQLMFKERTDTNRLFTYCEMRMVDTEFFIRKAIGWALRHYARTDPDAVRSFVTTNEASLSGLSKREALKNLV